MLQGGVGGEDGVVGLHNCSCNLRSGVDGELQFGFLAIIDRQALHEEGSEARAGATTERVEDQESLEASALVGLKR